MLDLPCGPTTHRYLRRWINWSKVAEIQAQRATDRKNANRRGGGARRRG